MVVISLMGPVRRIIVEVGRGPPPLYGVNTLPMSPR